MQQRTLVLHGTDVLVRAFLSVPHDVRTPDGRLTNALLGTARVLRRALSYRAPDRAVAVLDSAPPPGPPALVAQAQHLSALFAAHGIRVVTTDDPLHVVASYVEAARADGGVVVAGSDKRLAQLVAEGVWWYEGHKDVRYTPEAIRQRLGVPPAAAADWLALVGEDGILSGVKGIGKKGAVALIEQCGSLSAALQNLGAVTGRTGNALRAGQTQATAQLQQATLLRDRPLPVPLAALAVARADPEVLDTILREHALYALLAPRAIALDCGVADAAQAVAAVASSDLVSLHALIDDPSPPRGALVGLALSAGDGHGVYVRLPGAVPAILADWLEDPDAHKCGHDVKAITVALARRGVTLRGVVADAAIASHLADPSGMAPHDLPRIARAHLHRALATDDSVRGNGAGRKAWSALDPGDCAMFACTQAEAAGAAWRALAPQTDPEPLAEALALSEVLVGMERTGMAVDADDLRASGADFAQIGEGLQEEIHRLAGRAFSINSPRQLGSVLFEELGLPVLSRTKTGWSTSMHVLQRLTGAHPIVPLVIRWRQLRRLQDTWVTALIRAIDDDGRVRSTFHPARSFSGRLVNSHPDLGRVPGRTPELARIRRAFRARPGWTLLSVDYTQLGLYVLAHLTGDPALVEPLAAGGDIHRATAAAVLAKEVDAVTRDDRQLGKVVNFATFAGQGASALALQLGVAASEAKRIIARFDQRYAVTRAFQEVQLQHARDRGHVVTLAGRRWSIRGLASAEPRDLAYSERLARRATHEGSVADVTRRGLLRAAQALSAAGSAALPLVQIHDEVLFEVPEGELVAAAELTSEAMRGAFALRVPLRVGCKAGPNWADLRAHSEVTPP